MRAAAILDWQRRFQAGPSVWVVYSHGEDTGNVYESQEAAELEVAWRKARGERSVRVYSRKVHTLTLSQERWT